MNQVQQIEDTIVTGSDLHETHREDLHVTIRIAKDFYDFLVKYGESRRRSDRLHGGDDPIRNGRVLFACLRLSKHCQKQ